MVSALAMAHTRLLRFRVLFAQVALSALLLPSCDSGAVGESPLGSGGASASASAGSLTAGSTNASSGAPGNVSTAGNPGAAGNGSNSSGGMSGSAAGAPSTGGTCTDKPPNNGDTCAHAVEYNWCAQSWIGDSCQASCKKCTGGTGTGSGGSSSGGGSSGGGSS